MASIEKELEERRVLGERPLKIKLKPFLLRVFWRELGRCKDYEVAVDAAQAAAKAFEVADVDAWTDIGQEAELWIREAVTELGRAGEPGILRSKVRGKA